MNIFKCFFFAFLIFSSSIVYGQWYEVSAFITDICQTSNGAIYSVAGGGTIRKSTDAGTTWQLLNSKITGDLYSVCFPNNNVGFACGEDGLLKTIDGGLTWNIVFPAESGRNYYSICFLNENIGYLIDDIGDIFKTINSGSTWSGVYFDSRLTASTYDQFDQVLFINESVGFVCQTDLNGSSTNKIYSTKDGGASWQTSLRDGRYVQFIDGNIGYAIKKSNIISKTLDGGLTWSDYNLGVNDYFSKIKFNSNGIGFALGYAGSILKTNDGGITWVYQQSHIQHSLNAILFESSNNCIIVGANATILKSNNGGANWTISSLSPPSDLSIVGGNFVDDSTAFVLSGKGYISRTNDAGITWMPIAQIPGTGVFRDMCFIDKNNGLVAEDYKIWKTTDGGKNWSLKLTGTTEYVYRIFKLNQNELFCIKGHYGNYYKDLYKTSDGGDTWIDVNLKDYGVNSLAFYNDTAGIMVNMAERELYKTTDKGNTWSLWDYPNCNPCTSSGAIEQIAYSEGTLYIAGGYLWKSIDQGRTWTKIDYQAASGEALNLHFTDRSNGYILFPYGDFIKLDNEGTEHSDIKYRGREHYSYLARSFAFSNQHGIAFGDQGAIYRPFKIDGGFLTSVPNYKKRNNTLIIYPNPNNGVFKIHFSNQSTSEFIEIYNNSGQLVYKEKIHFDNDKIDVSNLPTGIYSIIIGTQHSKLIINK